MTHIRNVQQHYGSAVIGEGSEQVRVALTLPVDDMIWLGFNEAEHAEKWIAKMSADEAEREDFTLIAAGLQRRKMPAAFLAAARKAAAGTFPVEIAPYLAEVTFTPGDEPDLIPSYPSLVAWCLDRLLRTREFEVRDCAICGIPFLASPDARYCRRPAPTSAKQTCLEIGKVRDYQARKRAKKGTTDGTDR